MHLDLKAQDYPLLIDAIHWELDLLEELDADASPRYKRLVEIQEHIQAFVDDVPGKQKRVGSFIPRLRLSKLKPPSREFPYYFSENGVAFLGQAKEGDPVALKRLQGFGPLPKK